MLAGSNAPNMKKVGKIYAHPEGLTYRKDWIWAGEAASSHGDLDAKIEILIGTMEWKDYCR